MVAAAVVAAGAVSAVASYAGSSAQSEAIGGAADLQAQQAAESVAEQRRQFDAVQELMKPYVEAGTGTLSAQQNLIGLGGNAAQQAAINQIKQGSQFAELSRQGEAGILQNASATGGLRGGNVQGALAQFRPQLLQQLIDQQYNRLGGITSLGQNAAAMQGNAGMQTGQNISGILQQQGVNQGNAALAQGANTAQLYQSFGNTASNLAGIYAGYKG